MHEAIHGKSFQSAYRLSVRIAILGALVLSLSLLLGACGGDEAQTAAEQSPYNWHGGRP